VINEVETVSLTPEPVRRAALHAAYYLVEAVQLPDVVAARVEIADRLDEAERSGWPETTAALLFALAVDAFYNFPYDAAAAIGCVIDRAETLGEAGMLAAGLCLRAELALRDGDVVRHLADASRAVVVLDDENDPLARGSGLIGAANAYDSLSLWELGDEMHDRAEELLPLCDLQVSHPVIEFNRGINWFWWTAALLEVGEVEQAEQLLRDRTEDLQVEMPDSWALELRINRLAGQILMRAAGAEEVEELRALGHHFPAADDDGGLNWLPRMQVFLGLAHDSLRAGNYDVATTNADAARELARVHGTAYQRSFTEWTAMLIEEARDPTIGSVARAYAAGLARQRWDERIGRLASARAQIHSERQQGQHEGLVRRTMEDPLTGLGNRRAFDQRLVHECDSLTPQTTIAMVIIDVDHFKRVNDRFGHACGDAVLCRVGALLRSVLRPGDLALRLGGDEFCAVITGASPQVVQDRADRIGTLVILEDWESIAPGLAVTVSVGAATAAGAAAVADLYPRADTALYAAKAAGVGLLRLAQ
jgi:diguanylate cyclase (GGDEF)-like protein